MSPCPSVVAIKKDNLLTAFSNKEWKNNNFELEVGRRLVGGQTPVREREKAFLSVLAILV